jgi:glycosyltransferase involved in cell wall biosynthesis
MSRPVRVALVYDAVYPFQKGGGERRFHELARQLAADGVQVTLYGMRWWPGRDRVRVVDGVRVYGLCRGRSLYTASGRRSIPQALVFGLACLKLLWHSYDVIDCSGFPFFSLISCRLVATLRGKALISTWHEVWGPAYWREYLGRLGPAGALVERLAVRSPDRIVAVSVGTARRLRRELGYRKPIHLMPNGFDPTAIHHVAPASEPGDVVFVGRLIAPKGVDLLIGAVARVAAAGRRVRCLIVGDGPERSRLEAHARSLDVAQLVTFAGALPEAADVFGAMKAARVLALPSVREGFGMVALEANACGIPVITVDHPANAAAELVEHGQTGWVVPPTVPALADAIERALAGPARSPDAISAHVRRYAWPRLARDHALTQLYTPDGPPAGNADAIEYPGGNIRELQGSSP